MEKQQKTRNELVQEAISLLTAPKVDFDQAHRLLTQAKAQERNTAILDYQDYQIDFYLSIMAWTVSQDTSSFLKFLSENLNVFDSSKGTLLKLNELYNTSNPHLKLGEEMNKLLYYEISTMWIKSLLLDKVILELGKSSDTPPESLLLNLKKMVEDVNKIIREALK